MSDYKMLVWYGYDKTFKTFPSQIIPVLIKRYPNGSNAYYLKDTKETSVALSNGPSSHQPISLSFTVDEIKRLFPDKSSYQIAPILRDKINTFLLSTFSVGELIYDFICPVTNSSVHQFDAIYRGGDPVTVSESVLLKIKALVGISEEEEERWLSTIPDLTFQKEQIDPYPILDEAYILTLSVPFEVSELEVEFIAKCAFISNAYVNRWLCPYANRISWKVNEGSGTINVPIWDIDDAKGYEELLSLDYFVDAGSTDAGGSRGEILNPVRPQDPFSIQLSDGKWYLLPESIETDPDFKFPPLKTPSGSDTFVFEGKTYNGADVESMIPSEDNWRIKNISRVVPQIAQGLLPFVKPYPGVRLGDADDRLLFTKDEAGIVVSTRPDKYILGTYSSDVDMEYVKKRYTEAWNDGAFLTNGGHVNYKDSMSPIPFAHIRKIDIIL